MAAIDCFLKIEGIEGESHDAKHKGEIDVVAWSWGATQAGTMDFGGGGGAGKVDLQDFHFTARVSKASPKLMLACANGEHIPKVVLTCRKAGKEQQEYLRYTFTHVLVGSYKLGSAGSDLIPVEEVKLNFARVEHEYREQKADGSLGGAFRTGWDRKANKKI